MNKYQKAVLLLLIPVGYMLLIAFLLLSIPSSPLRDIVVTLLIIFSIIICADIWDKYHADDSTRKDKYVERDWLTGDEIEMDEADKYIAERLAEPPEPDYFLCRRCDHDYEQSSFTMYKERYGHEASYDGEQICNGCMSNPLLFRVFVGWSDAGGGDRSEQLRILANTRDDALTHVKKHMLNPEYLNEISEWGDNEHGGYEWDDDDEECECEDKDMCECGVHWYIDVQDFGDYTEDDLSLKLLTPELGTIDNFVDITKSDQDG